MQRALLLKIAVIVFLAIVLLIPLASVRDIIQERKSYRQEALQSIGSRWGGEQIIATPVLVLPYTINVAKLHQAHSTLETRYQVLPADSVELQQSLSTQTLSSGIYQIPVYQSDLLMRGGFDRQSIDQLYTRTRTALGFQDYQDAYLSLYISDVRGISDMPELTLNGKAASLVPGSKLRGLASGVHARLPMNVGAGGDIQFQFNLALKGSESISLAPWADEIKAGIEADWPHPRFGGMTLPLTRTINKTGFSASWQLSKFSTNNSQYIQDCVAQEHCQALTYANLITVDLIQPVDIYVQADRSAKYGILFILLTFLSFFIFETLRGKRIHPIQYGFVGFALALFYLLLVALSEHMQFAGAYAIAASVTLGVLTVYVTHIFKSRLTVATYGFATGGLYAVLYIIIQAEDFALLMGASLIFIVVALVMILTRRIDWYAVGISSAQGEKSSSVS